jgi:hypothetical protein
MVSRLARIAALVSTPFLSIATTAQLAALRAAGLNGSPPPNAGAFKHLIGMLTSNWEWLVVTGLGLVLILLGGMMAFGDIRAPERLFRVVGGIVVIMIVAPAMLA